MRSTISVRVAIGLALGLILVTSNARAQKFWNVSTGSWNDGNNWSPTGVPTSSTRVQINNGGTAQLTQAGGVAQGITLAANSGTSGTLAISGAGVLTTQNNNDETYIGYLANGTVNITGGGKLNTYRGYLGVFATNALGTVTVDGAGSQWTITNDLVAGRTGEGKLYVKNGGNITAFGAIVLGRDSGSKGTASIEQGSTVSTGFSSGIAVGNSGVGILDITGGSTLTAAYGVIANATTASGSIVTVDGATWTNSSFLNVGRVGTGTLNIKNDGIVQNTLSNIGLSAGSTGTVNVTGANSRWLNSSSLTIGGGTTTVGGNGTLNVSDGGLVTVGSPLKVWNNGKINVYDNGRLSVGTTGTGSRILSVGSSTVANTMEIVGGGIVDLASGQVTDRAVIDGLANTIVTINGNGSRLRTPLFLDVGSGSYGELRITGGALVESSGSQTFVTIGTNEGSTGVVTVDGTVAGDPSKPSKLTIDILTVGFRGDGQLKVTGKAVLNTKGVIIGNDAALFGGGTVTVNDSQWFELSEMVVGNFGNGYLDIVNGGKVNVGEPASLGSANLIIGKGKSGLTDVVTVDGSNSELTVFGDLTVADLGNGTLNIKNGAYVENDYAFIGYGGRSNGTVIVDNASWLNNELLTVGLLGNAVLDVRNFGVVAVKNGVFIGPGGKFMGTGTLTGDGVPLLVENNGIGAPGASPGTFHIDGDYKQGATGRLQIELASAASFDVLAITGQATLAGTLEIILTDGFTPAPTDTFNFLTFASRMGTFEDILVTTSSGGLGSFNLAFTPAGMTLSNYQPVAGLAGDFNGDNRVDAADYVHWRHSSNPTQARYDLWRNNFGRTSGSGAGSSHLAAVPEPAPLIMLLLGVSAISWRRNPVVT